MKSSAWFWIIVLVILLILGYTWMNKDNNSSLTPAPTATNSQLLESDEQSNQLNVVTVMLSEQNDLGQSGVASFMDNESGQLVVTLSMDGGAFVAPQPAHIHLGSCPTPGAVEYPLNSVENGVSETVLDMSWAELLSSGAAMAVNVHKSASEASIYTACGDLPMSPAVTQ